MCYNDVTVSVVSNFIIRANALGKVGTRDFQRTLYRCGRCKRGTL